MQSVFAVQMRRLSDGNKGDATFTLQRHVTLSNLRFHSELVPACVSLWLERSCEPRANMEKEEITKPNK